MGRYILKRLANSVFILLGTSLLAYLLIYLAPADPAQVIAAQRLGGRPNTDQIAWVRKEYGLDQPLLVQYLRWLQQAVQGDFGFSIRTGNLVSEEVGVALRYSLALALWTLGFVVLVGVSSGVWAALRQDSLWDQLIRLAALVSVSLPEFWLAFLLILLFAVNLGWLPSYGAKSSLHLILPMLSLGLGQAARLSRLTRTLLLNELGQDYLRTARAKGLTRSGALLHHALPNIAVPFVTLLAMQFGVLVSGALIVETLFTWPGLGSYYITAVNFRDIPVIQGMVMVFAVMIIVVNLLADLSYGLFDPRIRLG
jgi:ABC-type dipeptide/oligopeptide/nickel transport system permease component